MSKGWRAAIISCAVTGGADNAHMNPAIPIIPGQIAAEALATMNFGAHAMVNGHRLDPARPNLGRDGGPPRLIERYQHVA